MLQCEATVIGRVWLGNGKGWTKPHAHRCRNEVRPGTTRCHIHPSGGKIAPMVADAIALLESHGYRVTPMGRATQ